MNKQEAQLLKLLFEDELDIDVFEDIEREYPSPARSAWRYCSVGNNTWKLDNIFNHNPEDDMIARIDGEDEEEPVCPTNGLELLKILPPRLEHIMYLYYWEGLSQRAIGAVYGIKRARACQLMKKAKELLKDHWGDDEPLLAYLKRRRRKDHGEY